MAITQHQILKLPEPILAASPETWSHQSAYASLKANAKHFAGLENARTLIRQSRQIRYLRHAQLTDQRAAEEHADSQRVDLAEAEIPVLEQAA